VDLVYFVLCAFGLTNILVYGSIFNKIRPKHHFFHCPACMGFWVGAFLLGTNHLTELFIFEHTLYNAFVLGCLSSGTSYILAMLVGDKGVRSEVHQSKVGTTTSTSVL
tara:strand:- start:1008 stop:1331 length:324 start_codon:yes stop_codon:yes gene_type:complete